MELWIRSQDREMLCKAECVDLMHDTSGYAKVFLNGKFPDLIVGAYENKRALEVLDEIHRLLVPQISDLMRKIQKKDLSPKDIYNVYAIENTVTGQVDIREIQTLVYQMPKE